MRKGTHCAPGPRPPTRASGRRPRNPHAHTCLPRVPLPQRATQELVDPTAGRTHLAQRRGSATEGSLPGGLAGRATLMPSALQASSRALRPISPAAAQRHPRSQIRPAFHLVGEHTLQRYRPILPRPLRLRGLPPHHPCALPTSWHRAACPPGHATVGTPGAPAPARSGQTGHGQGPSATQVSLLAGRGLQNHPPSSMQGGTRQSTRGRSRLPAGPPRASGGTKGARATSESLHTWALFLPPLLAQALSRTLPQPSPTASTQHSPSNRSPGLPHAPARNQNLLRWLHLPNHTRLQPPHLNPQELTRTTAAA